MNFLPIFYHIKYFANFACKYDFMKPKHYNMLNFISNTKAVVKTTSECYQNYINKIS